MAIEREKIPEDLQELYAYASIPLPPNNFADECLKLIERIASAEQRVAEITSELASTEEMLEAQYAKFEGCPHSELVGSEHRLCGCSFDKPSDVCAFHAPQLRKSQERVAELQDERNFLDSRVQVQQHKIAELEQQVERLKAPVSDKEWMTECGVDWQMYNNKVARQHADSLIAKRASARAGKEPKNDSR